LTGEKPIKTYIIPFRSWASPKHTWNDLFEAIRGGYEELFWVQIINGDTVEFKTKCLKSEG